MVILDKAIGFDESLDGTCTRPSNDQEPGHRKVFRLLASEEGKFELLTNSTRSLIDGNGEG